MAHDVGQRHYLATGLYEAAFFGSGIGTASNGGDVQVSAVGSSDGHCTVNFWSPAPAGGQSTVHRKHSPPTPVSDCEHHDPLDSFGGDLGTAVDWSAGFELGAALGVKGVNVKASFNGSALTGYDTNAFMQFTFGHHGGYLCGTNGTESTAAILVQRNNKP